MRPVTDKVLLLEESSFGAGHGLLGEAAFPVVGADVENLTACLWVAVVRGAVQFFFGVNLGFCPNRLDPPPPPLPERWDTNNSKKNFDVYFAF